MKKARPDYSVPALGIISFALLAVIGLLPVSLKSVKNASENAGAANVLQAITATIRSATSANSSDFNTRFALRGSARPLQTQTSLLGLYEGIAVASWIADFLVMRS